MHGSELAAGVVFEHHNGVTAWAHVAVDKPLSRTFLRAFLAYPFKVCGLKSVRGVVLASNTELRALARRLGAVEEAVLKDVARDADALVYVLSPSFEATKIIATIK